MLLNDDERRRIEQEEAYKYAEDMYRAEVRRKLRERPPEEPITVTTEITPFGRILQFSLIFFVVLGLGWFARVVGLW